MKKPFSSFNTRGVLPAVLGAGASVFLVAVITFAATTVGNNINTGGSLTVSGASILSSTLAVSGDSTLTGTTTVAGGIYASSTVFTDGIFTNTRNVVLGTASVTPTVTGLNVTGSGYFTGGLGVGYATTGSGHLLVNGLTVIRSTGRFGFGSTSPYREVGITGDASYSSGGTTTVSAESTAGNGCIELRAADGKWIRLYAGSAATTSGNSNIASLEASDAGVKTALILQAGRCEDND